MSAPIFISHCSKDRKTALTLCVALERRGLACWISARDIRAGENFQEAICAAIEDATVMILVFTENANNSDEVKREIALASQKHMLVVPIRVEDVTPNPAFRYELATRQWIDLFDNWETAMERLVSQIEEVLGSSSKGGSSMPPQPRLRAEPPGAGRRRPLHKVFPTRTILVTLVAAAVIAVSVTAVRMAGRNSSNSIFHSTVERTAGLLAYWTFAPETGAKSAVNGYTASLKNGAVIGGSGSGPPIHDPDSSAVILNADSNSQEFVLSEGAKPLHGQIDTAGSILAWFKLARLPSEANRIFSIAGESQHGNDFDLQIDIDNKIHFYTDTGSSTVAPTNLKPGEWLFVGATFESLGMRQLYVNGELVANSTASEHLRGDATFFIGQSNHWPDRYFSGRISDVAIFDRSLTAAEIGAIYDSVFGPAVQRQRS